MNTRPIVEQHLLEIARAVQPAEQRALERHAEYGGGEECGRQRCQERPAERFISVTAI